MIEDTKTTVEKALKTAETWASQLPAPTTKNSVAKSYRDKLLLQEPEFKRQWINKRLGLDRHHPSVVELEGAVWDFCRAVADNPRRGKRYVVSGNNGCAKTRCARAIRKWIDDRAIDLPLVDCESGLRTIDCLMVNWAERVGLMKQGHWDIDDMTDATVLILDDIGAEHDPSRAGVEKLYLVLENREKRHTWITTNLPPAQWEGRFDRRVADRLFRNSLHIDMSKCPSYSVNT